MQAMITNSFVSDTLGVNNDLEICTHCEEMVDWFLATTTSYQLIILFCNQSPNKFMASNMLFMIICNTQIYCKDLLFAISGN